HRMLGWGERLIVVAVGRHAIPVQSAKIEIPNLALLVGSERARVAHRENGHVGIDWHPAIRRDVHLAPIVNGLVTGTGVPTRLPAGGNAVEPTKRDKKESLLAAIAVLFGAAIIADVADGGVFDCVA